MKIIALLTAALVSAALFNGVAVAQPEAFAEDAYVTVTFGAVMMQVPAKLAVQLCPGVELDELVEANQGSPGVACAIPNEEYTSHAPDADTGSE